MDWKHYPKEASCYLAVRGSDGNLCMTGLEDAIKVFDDIITEFDTNGIIKNKHLPMYIEAAVADNGSGEQYIALFHMWNAVEKDYPVKETPLNEFNLGDLLVHKETGIHLRVRARVYYAIRMQWYYVVTPTNKQHEEPQQLQEDILWPVKHFNQLIFNFSKQTEETWYWDNDTGRVVNLNNRNRKMTPQDLVKQLELLSKDKEVPF